MRRVLEGMLGIRDRVGAVVYETDEVLMKAQVRGYPLAARHAVSNPPTHPPHPTHPLISPATRLTTSTPHHGPGRVLRRGLMGVVRATGRVGTDATKAQGNTA